MSSHQGSDRNLGAGGASQTSAQRSGGDIRENLQDVGSKAREVAQQAAGQVRDVAQERLGQLRNTAEEYYQMGRDRASDLERTLEERIREKPLNSVLMAAGLGVLLGIIWTRR